MLTKIFINVITWKNLKVLSQILCNSKQFFYFFGFCCQSVYFWDFLLISWTGRYQREEDTAQAGDWVESVIFNRIGIIQIIISLAWCIYPPDGKFTFSQELRHSGKEGKDKKCHFLKSHLLKKEGLLLKCLPDSHRQNKMERNENVVPGRGIRSLSIYQPQANKLQWIKIVQVIQRSTVKDLSVSKAAQCSN